MNLTCAECGEELKQNKGVALKTATLSIHHEKVGCNMTCFKNFHQNKSMSLSLGVPFYYKIEEGKEI